MEINIKIDGLAQLTEALALLGSAMAYKKNMVATSKEAVELMDGVSKEDPKAVEAKKIKEAKEKDPKPKQESEPKFTREEVRAAFIDKNSPTTRETLKALLEKYNTANISELAEDDFEAVMKDLEEI